MKTRLSKFLSCMIVITMVIASTGTTFAAGKDSGKISHDDIQKNSKSISSSLDGKREAAKDSPRRDMNEKFDKAFTDSKSSEKMRAGRTLSEGSVAQIGNVEYPSLQEAVNQAVDGDTIYVLNDIEDEFVEIDPGVGNTLTIEFDYWTITSDAVDVISVYSGNVTIKNAAIINLRDNIDEEVIPTGVVAFDSAVRMENCAVCTYGDNSVGYYAGTNSKMTLEGCYYEDAGLLDEGLPIDVVGCVVDETARAVLNDCDIQTLYGDGVFCLGTATINYSYITVDEDEYAAVIAGYGGKVSINDGYYFGDPGLWINDIDSQAIVKKGEFHAMYQGSPAIDCFDDESYGVNVMIADGAMASPSDWDVYGDDYVCVYKRYPAPSTVTPKLYKYYNGISLSWSPVSEAKAYKVYYKKSTASGYNLLTTTTGTSVKKTGLTAGAKYQFRVYPCDKLDRTDTPVYGRSSNYRYNSIYTLKRVSTPTVTKSGSSVKVKWKNISGETGYQISKSTSKSGTNIVSTYQTTGGTYKTIKATKGKTYYYKVRAYKTVDGSRIYGPWSYTKAYKRR